MFAKPDLVFHADWSTTHPKRWSSEASLGLDGHYIATGPKRVVETSQLLQHLRRGMNSDKTLFAGFDFPIGLPTSYAKRVGITKFRDFLPEIGNGNWASFFSVCQHPEEISGYRPFYPNHSKKGSRRQDLLKAHAVIEMGELLRQCERGGNGQRKACSLFWTLGGNQVGKAAIAGWRDVLIPSIADDSVRLWPFDGTLRELFKRDSVIVAETYPAECYRWFSKIMPKKTDIESRREFGSKLLSWADTSEVRLAEELRMAIQKGFPDGEDDAFDSAVGLFGMLQICLKQRGSGEPPDPLIAEVEGWILGRTAPTAN